jgi:predicted GTPase
LEKEINILKEKNKELNSKIKILDKIEEKQNLGKNPLDFYDIIVNINSMQNIKNGWEVKINENGKKIIDSKEKNKKLVIGVMGNRNKGKSFLLQAISGEKMQTGTTINTIGLSIKFSEDKFVLLDSEGSESPILGEHTSMLDISRDKLFT